MANTVDGNKAVINNTDNQTVGGVKTFSSAPVFPTTTGYINFGGIKICWGTASGGGSGGTTVTFPVGVSFTSAPSVAVTLTENSNKVAVGITPTTTNFVWYSYIASTGGGSESAMSWIAVGV